MPDPESYGVAELDGGRVDAAGGEAEGAEVRPRPGRRLHVHAGDHRGGKAISPSGRGELEITDAIQHLIDRGLTVEPHKVTGWWKDTGQLEDMLEANRLMLDDVRAAGATATVDDESTIEGRVVVEAGRADRALRRPRARR